MANNKSTLVCYYPKNDKGSTLPGERCVSWKLSMDLTECVVLVEVTIYSLNKVEAVPISVFFNTKDDTLNGYAQIRNFARGENLTRAIIYDDEHHNVVACICRLSPIVRADRIIIHMCDFDSFMLSAFLFYNMKTNHSCEEAFLTPEFLDEKDKRNIHNFTTLLQLGMRSATYVGIEGIVSQKSVHASLWRKHRHRAFFGETSSEHVYWLCKRLEFLAKRESPVRKIVAGPPP